MNIGNINTKDIKKIKSIILNPSGEYPKVHNERSNIKNITNYGFGFVDFYPILF